MTELNIDMPAPVAHIYEGEVAITTGKPEVPSVHPSGLAEVLGWMARDLATIEALKRAGADSEEIIALKRVVDLRANVLNCALPLPDQTTGWQDIAEKYRLQEAQLAADFAVDEAFRQ